MTNEEIREKIASLESDKEELLDHLDKINYLGSKRQLKKAELKEEADIRKEIQEIDKKLLSLKDQLLNNKKESTFGQRLALSLGVICLCGVIGVFIGKTAKKNCAPVQSNSNVKSISITAAPEVTPKNATVNATVVPATAAPTAMPTPVPTAVPTATPTPEPTVVPDVVVDVTNDENVSEAAANIYESYIMPILEKNPALNDSFTIEEVEDIIRMANSKLPVNSKYNEYTIGGTANTMNDMFANQGNHNVLYPFDFSKLYPEGSNEAKYIKTYDDIYRKIAEYRAEGNGDGVVEQIGKLGEKLYNEWHIQGMNGGYNPYLLSAKKPEERYFLLQAATSRFSNYVREYLESNDLTVCIPTCYDVEPGKYRDVEIRDIFEALYADNATSRNGAISIVDETGKPIRVFAEAFAEAKAYFDARANVKVKSLG